MRPCRSAAVVWLHRRLSVSALPALKLEGQLPGARDFRGWARGRGAADPEIQVAGGPDRRACRALCSASPRVPFGLPLNERPVALLLLPGCHGAVGIGPAAKHPEQPQRAAHDGDSRPIHGGRTRWASTPPSTRRSRSASVPPTPGHVPGARSRRRPIALRGTPHSFQFLSVGSSSLDRPGRGRRRIAGGEVGPSGGIFYVLVDNSAQAASRPSPRTDPRPAIRPPRPITVFGIILIVLMYLMPMGIVGGVLLRGAQQCARPRPQKARRAAGPSSSGASGLDGGEAGIVRRSRPARGIFKPFQAVQFQGGARRRLQT